MRREPTTLAYGAATLAAFGWGSLYAAAKPALREVTPLMVAFDRAAIACLALSVLVCIRSGGPVRGVRRIWREARDAGAGVAALGVVSFAGTSLVAMTAQQFLPASVNGLLNNLSPLYLALYVALTGRARSAALLLVGSVLAAGGVAVVLLGDALPAPVGRGASIGAGDGGRFWLGAGTSLAGSALIAYSTLLARRVMARRDPIALTSAAAFWGTLPLLVGLLFGLGGSLPGFVSASSVTKGLLLWMGTMSTAFNFSLWYFALSHLPVSRVANFSYLIPPLSVVIAVLVLHESAGLPLLLGTLAIVGGIALAHGGAEPA